MDDVEFDPQKPAYNPTPDTQPDDGDQPRVVDTSSLVRKPVAREDTTEQTTAPIFLLKRSTISDDFEASVPSTAESTGPQAVKSPVTPTEASSPPRSSMWQYAAPLSTMAGGAAIGGSLLTDLSRHIKSNDPVDLGHLHPEFAQNLDATCRALDAAGYAGQYDIISGCRNKEQQQRLWDYYKSIGSKHPVAFPGTSPHESGLAADFQFTGQGSQEKFYSVLHATALHNGMELVDGDPNHIQAAGSRQKIAEMKSEKQNTSLASLAHHVLGTLPGFAT